MDMYEACRGYSGHPDEEEPMEEPSPMLQRIIDNMFKRIDEELPF